MTPVFYAGTDQRVSMSPGACWIDGPTVGRLAIMARPRAGDWLADEVAGWRADGIDVVVSLLEPDEIAELGLDREAGLCRRQGIEFMSFAIPDRGVPASLREATALARLLARRVGDGKAIAVHCRAGIGRSSLIAACVLVCLGAIVSDAFDSIGKARGVQVPDIEGQREWVAVFRDAVVANL